MPVYTHNLRMLQSRANIGSIGLATLLLILDTNQRVVEHTLIHRTKVELADNHRLVESLWLTIVGKGEVVHIVADSVAILRADEQCTRIRRATSIAATEIQHAWCTLVEHLANASEVGVDNQIVELHKVGICLLWQILVVVEQRLPRCE